MLKVTLKKSPIGYSTKHKRTCLALGLRKMNHTVTVPDNSAIRGMIHRVQFLVEVEKTTDVKEGSSDV
jgi:large subunit ribosomal protein L30